jgi:hypothetical protein
MRLHSVILQGYLLEKSLFPLTYCWPSLIDDAIIPTNFVKPCYAHLPGLKVLAPYSAEDARGLLKAAIRDPDARDILGTVVNCITSVQVYNLIYLIMIVLNS